ncbi:MAG TPA: metalloregulator ArsR/SmtB family transcription factor [Aestuariivirga sp.]|nr:metalloregulator ArsR/SmtB family transcription factor [Aestuariivirga sp.]
MVELQSVQMNSVFHALGDATRRRMLRELAGGERTVGQLAEPFAISLNAASKHIKALESAGLIRREVRGRTHVCRLEAGPLASAHEWLNFYERFWTNRLDALDRLLREEDARQSPKSKKGDDK